MASLEDQLNDGKISIRTYLEAVHNRDVGRLEGCLDAVEKAILLQDALNKERFEIHNRFREQIERERMELVRKDDLSRVEHEVLLRFEVIEDKLTAAIEARDKVIDLINSRQANMEGRWLASTVIGGLLIGGVGLAATLLMLL